MSYVYLVLGLVVFEFLMICVMQIIQRKRVENGAELGWTILHLVGLVIMMTVLLGSIGAGFRMYSDSPQPCTDTSGEGTCNPTPSQPSGTDPPPR